MKKTIWSSIKYQCKEFIAKASIFLSRLCFWRWEKFTFSASEKNPITVHYIGHKKHLDVVKSLLGSTGEKVKKHSNKATIYEVPLPQTLCIPHCLSTVIRLDRSAEEIMASYSKSLRRSILKSLPDFHYKTLTDASQLDYINETMLKPYAVQRNGESAQHLDIRLIEDMAFNHFGRLDLLYEKDELIGCHLGHSYFRKGKKYWQVNRFGYIKDVFSDYKRYQNANSINLHLALLSAVENNYDYCDYGMSAARPGKGLLEWKRRRKGFLTKADGNCFFLKPPQSGAAQFFWDTPLLALEGKKVTLHLGIPANKTDEEIIGRYREMGYDGLRKVYLKCTIPPSENVIKALESLYTDYSIPPQIIISNAT